ncbi:unnamed protein product [Caenorhabditis angaria]|uniref:Uncharacterized protein n=1 Tax=Caenorhabditis angaria TaxID=860376 RepID=A0A9P1I7M5_9PELO|nr:unnamed protein product [Caenorhabditis angaria]
METKSPFDVPPPNYTEAINSAATAPPQTPLQNAPTQYPAPQNPPILVPGQQQQFVVQGAQFAQIQPGQQPQPIFIIQGQPAAPRPPTRVIRVQRGRHQCMTPEQMRAARRRKMISQNGDKISVRCSASKLFRCHEFGSHRSITKCATNTKSTNFGARTSPSVDTGTASC